MKKEYLIYKLSEEMKEATRIDNELFPKFDVKRGLRNEDGTGVLVGLTKIGNVVGYEPRRRSEANSGKIVLSGLRCGRHFPRHHQGKTFRLRRSGLSAAFRSPAGQGRTGFFPRTDQ